MGFSSVDDFINEAITNGKYFRTQGFRTINTGATSVAGRWHECFAGTGSGGTGVLTGTAGLGTVFSSSTTGAIPQPTVTVSTDTKHLVTFQGVTPGTTAVPGQLLLTDITYIYPSLVVTGAPTTLNNGAAKPTRHNNGVGIMCSVVVASALGAATPRLTFTYTDQGGTGSNTGDVTASANSLPVGSMLTGGTAATLGSPYMTLAAGDTGVRQLDSYTIPSGSTTGTVTAILHRPIATIPLVAANTPGERDLMFSFPSLPKIDDDACLALFLLVGGALTTNNQVTYEIGAAWG